MAYEAIPNEEVKYIYENTIREWFQTKIQSYDFTDLYRSVLEKDINTMEEQIRENHSCEDLSADGYENILSYGICFCKKPARSGYDADVVYRQRLFLC
ncbi:MAG: hypothetical protein PUB10_05525 [Clostridiales bacterium]|nr:hypothetical protein [Clostridiales bacterium]